MRAFELLIERADPFTCENEQVLSLKNQLLKLKGNSPFIELTVGNTKINAADITQLGRGPKADLTILNENSRPVAWISLKCNRSRYFFWGQFSDIKKLDSQFEWLNIFVDDLRAVTGGQLKNGESFTLQIHDDILQKKLMYGKNFGSEKFGINNVNMVLIGNPNITKDQGGYTLTSDEKNYVNGESPIDNDIPVLMARYYGGMKGEGILDTFLNAIPKYKISKNSLPLDTSEQIKIAKTYIQQRRGGEILQHPYNKKPLTPQQKRLKIIDDINHYRKENPTKWPNYESKEKKVRFAREIISKMLNRGLDAGTAIAQAKEEIKNRVDQSPILTPKKAEPTPGIANQTKTLQASKIPMGTGRFG